MVLYHEICTSLILHFTEPRVLDVFEVLCLVPILSSHITNFYYFPCPISHRCSFRPVTKLENHTNMTRALPSRLIRKPTLWQTRTSSPIWATHAEGTSADKSDWELLRSPAKKTTPPLLFPWRHGTELPQRLIKRQETMKDESITYDVSTTGISTMTAAFYFSNVSFFRLFGNQWKTDLAESCSWAFFQGLACILSDVYHGRQSLADYSVP